MFSFLKYNSEDEFDYDRYGRSGKVLPLVPTFMYNLFRIFVEGELWYYSFHLLIHLFLILKLYFLLTD